MTGRWKRHRVIVTFIIQDLSQNISLHFLMTPHDPTVFPLVDGDDQDHTVFPLDGEDTGSEF